MLVLKAKGARAGEGSLTQVLEGWSRGRRRPREPACDPAGACAFLALLLHALEIQSLRMKPSPPQFSIQWPYYVLGFSILLFMVAGE